MLSSNEVESDFNFFLNGETGGVVIFSFLKLFQTIKNIVFVL